MLARRVGEGENVSIDEETVKKKKKSGISATPGKLSARGSIKFLRGPHNLDGMWN